MSTEFPPVEDLLPHAGPMVLLSRVLAHDAEATLCAARVDAANLFADEHGRLGGWLSIEYMAQAVAVHAGLTLRDHGDAPRLGLLLGARRVRVHAPFLSAGQALRVGARRVWGRRAGFVAFDCVLDEAHTGQRLAEGRLSCLLAPGRRLEGRM